MVRVTTATLTAGVMLLRSKRVRHHFSQTPPPGTDHYEIVDEVEKRAPLDAGVYEELDKQDRQTDEHTKHYQELDLAKMEKRTIYATIKAWLQLCVNLREQTKLLWSFSPKHSSFPPKSFPNCNLK